MALISLVLVAATTLHPTKFRAACGGADSPRSASISMDAVRSPAEGGPSTAAEVEFPPEASPLVQLQRGAVFASRALPIAFSYIRLYTALRFRERALGQCLDEEACEVLWTEQHEAGSISFASVVNELKGFYTKTGQIIATRQARLSRHFRDTSEAMRLARRLGAACETTTRPRQGSSAQQLFPGPNPDPDPTPTLDPTHPRPTPDRTSSHASTRTALRA